MNWQRIGCEAVLLVHGHRVKNLNLGEKNGSIKVGGRHEGDCKGRIHGVWSCLNKSCRRIKYVLWDFTLGG